MSSLAVPPPRLAGSVPAMVEVPSATPVMLKVAEVVPAGIVTVAGTDAMLAFEDVRATVVLFASGALNLTVTGTVASMIT